MKRAFDLAVAVFALALAAPLCALVAFLIALDSKGPVLFRQQRVGQHGRPFSIYKFRTMSCGHRGPTITLRGDPRVTRSGALLRRWKLDELPQLLNVLKGEMSLVGPRPETLDHVRLYTPAQRMVLSVKPGLTSWASLRYWNEEALLANATNPQSFYVERIMPTKLALDMDYIRRQSIGGDLAILASTLRMILLRHGRTP
jgi:lipopolysaccharide/colanic/teichoic acid biosynthesis glycosyltransferase